MIKKFFILLLVLAVISSAFLSQFNISPEYSITPYKYARRIINAFDAFPEFELQSFEGVFDRYTPQYREVLVVNVTWYDIEVDGLTDVIPAMKRFIDNIGQFFGSYFSALLNVFPNLWHNYMEFSAKASQPLLLLYDNFKSIVETISTAKEWRYALASAIIPFDWEKWLDDGNTIQDIELPFGLHKIINKQFIEKYHNGGHRGGR